VGAESIEAGMGNHSGGRVLHEGGGSSGVNWSRSRVNWSWGGVDGLGQNGSRCGIEFRIRFTLGMGIGFGGRDKLDGMLLAIVIFHGLQSITINT